MQGRSAEDIMAFASNMRQHEEPDSVIILNSANFDEIVINQPNPFLVMFYAPWHSICNKISPDFSKLAKE